MKTRTVEAIEYNGKLYKSKDDLATNLASDVIWKSCREGEWSLNPKETYRKLKEIYENDD